jgi:hypothetical protein
MTAHRRRSTALGVLNILAPVSTRQSVAPSTGVLNILNSTRQSVTPSVIPASAPCTAPSRIPAPART